MTTNMSTNDNKTIEISTTDVDLTSEMDVPLPQTSQIDESNTLASVETVTLTSISTRSENKPDETSAMMQLLLKLDKKMDEQKNEITEIKSEITVFVKANGRYSPT